VQFCVDNRVSQQVTFSFPITGNFFPPWVEIRLLRGTDSVKNQIRTHHRFYCQMKKNATIKDIARHLGISAATVSRAMRDHSNISQERKESVWEVARKLNYHPDSVAQSLKSGQTQTIGVILPAIKYHFFSEALDGIEDVAFKAGYTVLLCKSNESHDREVLNAEMLASKRVAGIIVSLSQDSRNTEHFSGLMQRNVPVVFFDRVPEKMKAPKVVVDDYDAAFSLTEYLIGAGYRNIAHLSGPESLLISRLRMQGYLDALKKHGISPPKDGVIYGGLEEEDGKTEGMRILTMRPRPDAVFAVNDPVALGIYRACKEAGMKIPQNLAVAGFSDNPISALLTPPLTTVSQPAYEIGIAAAKMLLERIKEGNPIKSELVVCKTKLIVREST
jgi:LacI family transcriptional regulator